MGRLIEILFIILLLCVSLSSSSQPYSTTGIITENGDDYWDSGEISFYKVELFKNESLYLEFRGEGNLELMLCNCYDYSDIETIAADLQDYGDSSDLYLWIDNYSYQSDSYYSSGHKTMHIAIFSVDPYNPSIMSFTLEHSLPLGSRDNPNAISTYIEISNPDENSNDNSNSDGNVGWIFLSYVAIVIGIIYFVSKRHKKTKSYQPHTSYNPNAGYQQGVPNYGYSSQTNNPTSSISPNQVYCSACGKPASGFFCSNCGAKL